MLSGIVSYLIGHTSTTLPSWCTTEVTLLSFSHSTRMTMTHRSVYAKICPSGCQYPCNVHCTGMHLCLTLPYVSLHAPHSSVPEISDGCISKWHLQSVAHLGKSGHTVSSHPWALQSVYMKRSRSKEWCTIVALAHKAD